MFLNVVFCPSLRTLTLKNDRVFKFVWTVLNNFFLNNNIVHEKFCSFTKNFVPLEKRSPSLPSPSCNSLNVHRQLLLSIIFSWIQLSRFWRVNIIWKKKILNFVETGACIRDKVKLELYNNVFFAHLWYFKL